MPASAVKQRVPAFLNDSHEDDSADDHCADDLLADPGMDDSSRDQVDAEEQPCAPAGCCPHAPRMLVPADVLKQLILSTVLRSTAQYCKELLIKQNGKENQLSVQASRPASERAGEKARK